MYHIYGVDPSKDYTVITAFSGPPIIVYGNANAVIDACMTIIEKVEANGDRVQFVVDATGFGAPIADMIDNLRPDENNVIRVIMTRDSRRMMERIMDVKLLLKYATRSVNYG